MPKTHEEVYAKLMLTHGHGYGLWQPDPLDEYDCVQPGDIGHIIDGKFHPSSELSMWSNPERHPPMLPTFLTQHIMAEKPLVTSKIKQLDASMSLGSGVEGSVSVGAEINYHCCGEAGALLSLKDGYALSRKLSPRDMKAFQQYFIETCKDLPADLLQTMVGIVGCTTTGDFDAALFQSNSSGGHISVNISSPPIILSKTSLTLRESTHQSIHCSSGHRHNPPHSDPQTRCCVEEKKNQCIFVRGLRLRRRLGSVFPKDLKAAAEPQDPDKDDRPAPPGSSQAFFSSTQSNMIGETEECHISNLSSSSESTSESPESEECTHYDWVFNFLFMHSDAMLALVYDGDALWIEEVDRLCRSNPGHTVIRGFITINEESGESVASLTTPKDFVGSNEPCTVALCLACETGQLGFVKVLVESGLCISEDPFGGIALCEASKHGHIDIIKLLFEHGAVTTAVDNLGSTPLHEASRAGHIEIVEYLLQHGADILVTNTFGDTPLLNASRAEHGEIVKLLLERGAIPISINNFKLNPGHDAPRGGHVETVKVPLVHGAMTAVAGSDEASREVPSASSRRVSQPKGYIGVSSASSPQRNQPSLRFRPPGASSQQVPSQSFTDGFSTSSRRLPAIESRINNLEHAVGRFVDRRAQHALQRSKLPGTDDSKDGNGGR